MEEVPAYELNNYLTEKKDLYELLTGQEFNYYLPSMKSNCLSVDLLLKIGNDQAEFPY